MPEDTYGSITEEGLDDLRERIGVEIDEPEPHVHEATLDTIRHWAHGIGCDDPLYTDEGYAADGPYGELVAPPSFLYATSKIVSGYVGGLPGVHAMYSGTDWTWHEPIRRDTRVEPRSWLSDLVEKDTDFAGRAIQQIYTTEFYDDEGTLLAEADSWCFRTERDTASEDQQKYESEGVELADWDESDRQRFADHYRQEEPRGDEPRSFESVSVGDELDTLLKGPMTVTNVIAFDQGWGGLYVEAHKRFFEMLDAHPALGIPNSQGAPEPPEQVHWNDEFARDVGVPAAYDYGPERIAWLSHACHHWMGDHGRLRSLRGEVRRHNLMGDVVWVTGEVVDRRVENDANLVEVDLQAHDQRDELSAMGSATIELPGEDEL
jgi:acyl dehydratase